MDERGCFCAACTPLIFHLRPQLLLNLPDTPLFSDTLARHLHTRFTCMWSVVVVITYVLLPVFSRVEF